MSAQLQAVKADTFEIVYDPSTNQAMMYASVTEGTCGLFATGHPINDRLDAEAFALGQGFIRSGDWQVSDNGVQTAPMVPHGLDG
jgi:hypothetical protein